MAIGELRVNRLTKVRLTINYALSILTGRLLPLIDCPKNRWHR